MAKDPAFLFYSKDWLEGTAEYMPDEKGVYIDLLCHQHQKGSLPEDTIRLARMVGLPHEKFLEIWKVINLNFNRSDNRLVNHKLNQVMTERAEKSQVNTIIGTFAGLLRFGKYNPEQYKYLKTKFKPTDFIKIEKEKLTERITEWITDRLSNGGKSIANAIGIEDEDITVIEPEIIKEEFEEKKPQKEEKRDFIDSVILVFQEAYEETNEVRYEITNKGKERSATGKLIKIFKERYPDSKTEDTLESMRTYFNACVSIDDNWLRKNMSLPIILDKFNQINNILRNGNKKGGGVTNTELATIIAKHFANG
jgi:uncharacterized protein YdaU (DUF1376 family)